MLGTTVQPRRKALRFSTERLRLVRNSKGLSMEAFGAAIGKTGRSIQNWEAAKTSPTMRDIERIGEVFDVDISFFLTPEN